MQWRGYLPCCEVGEEGFESMHMYAGYQDCQNMDADEKRFSKLELFSKMEGEVVSALLVNTYSSQVETR